MANQFIVQKLKPAAIEFFRFLGGMRHEILIPHTVGRYTKTAVHFEWSSAHGEERAWKTPPAFKPRRGSQLVFAANGLSLALKGFGPGTGLFRCAFGGNLVHLFAVVRLVNANLKHQVDNVACAPVERKS